MFKEIVFYELKDKFTRISTYIYFGVFFLIAFLIMISIGGAIDGAHVSIGAAGEGKVFINSPLTIFMIVTFLSYFGMFVITAMAGSAACKDFEEQSYPLIFTTPVTKSAYLIGRFSAAFLVSCWVLSGTILGSWLGTVMPFIKQDMLGPSSFLTYIQPYLVGVVPNVFFITALFFAFGLNARKMMPIYVSTAVLFMGYLIAMNVVGQLKQRVISALIDPFGFFATTADTQYWTTPEINTRLVPFNAYLLLNRVLWVGIAIAIGVFVYRKFILQMQKDARSQDKKSVATAVQTCPVSSLPDQKQVFSLPAIGKTWWTMAQKYTRSIIKNRYFAVLAFLGVAFMLYIAKDVGSMYETLIYPVTWAMITITSGTFGLFMLIIILFYAGELVWYERQNNTAKYLDALPHPDWVPFTAKIGTMFFVIAVFQTIIMFSGMLVQTLYGFFQYNIPVYMIDLYLIQMPHYFLYAILALSVQNFVNNKYSGHFLVVLIIVISRFMSQFGFEHSLYRLFHVPGVTYSDMNGYGHFIYPQTIYTIYWAFFAVLLAIVAYCFRVRGVPTFGKNKVTQALKRWKGSVRTASIAAVVVFIAMGGFIFYNTNILNEFSTRLDSERSQRDYELLYKKYESHPQLRVIDIQTVINLYPKEKRFTFKGNYRLKNKTAVPIQEIIIQNPLGYFRYDFTFDKKNSRTLFDDKYDFMIYTLEEPVKPGEECTMAIDLEFMSNGFTNNGASSYILDNGTFINSRYFPLLGYQRDHELQTDKLRKKHGLKPKDRMASIDDMAARMNTYISDDSDWVTMDITIGTDKGQTALAPGNLLKEWIDGDRHYYQYSPERKVLNFYAVCSADYAVKKDTWNNVAIEIYYDKKHPYNVDRMITGIKRSLDYFTTNFSPYPDKVIRIVEFPRYGIYAQSFPTMIPYSEGIGFIAKVKKDTVDYPFEITAHEMAHQWWAHQVIGGNVQGATLISEVFAQYSGMMVTEREYSPKMTRKIIKYDMDSYLRARGDETKKEPPLYLDENLGYLHYRKGIVVMNSMRYLIGEDKLNAALAEFVKKTAFQEPPYTTSKEFLDILRKYITPAQEHLVADMFEKITIYDLELKQTSAVKKSDTAYDVVLTVSTGKKYADEQGVETEAPMTDEIVVALYNQKDEEISRSKFVITGKDQKITITTDQVPARAALDPDYLFIDQNLENNEKKISIK